MRESINHIMSMRRENYIFKTLSSAFISTAIGIAFTIFNGVLGVIYHSVWNISICIYYILLTLIRAIILISQRKGSTKLQKKTHSLAKRVCVGTHILLFLMDIALIAPIAYMIKGERSYNYGLIPAIAMAAYTTYRITLAIYHMVKSKRTKNILVKELRTIAMQDALVSVLALQNALIIANNGSNEESMKTLMICSSTGIWILIVLLSIRSFYSLKTHKSSIS